MDEELTLGQLKIKQAIEWRDAVARHNPTSSNKIYIGRQESYLAFLFVLENGTNAKEALEHVANETNKDDDWVNKVKHNAIHIDIINYLLDILKEHPIMLSMKSEGLMCSGIKRSLKTARSVSNFLNTLSNLVKVVNRITELEYEVKLYRKVLTQK